MDLPIAKLVKLAEVASVMHGADHAYSIPGDCIDYLPMYHS